MPFSDVILVQGYMLHSDPVTAPPSGTTNKLSCYHVLFGLIALHNKHMHHHALHVLVAGAIVSLGGKRKDHQQNQQWQFLKRKAVWGSFCFLTNS